MWTWRTVVGHLVFLDIICTILSFFVCCGLLSRAFFCFATVVKICAVTEHNNKSSPSSRLVAWAWEYISIFFVFASKWSSLVASASSSLQRSRSQLQCRGARANAKEAQQLPTTPETRNTSAEQMRHCDDAAPGVAHAHGVPRQPIAREPYTIGPAPAPRPGARPLPGSLIESSSLSIQCFTSQRRPTTNDGRWCTEMTLQACTQPQHKPGMRTQHKRGMLTWARESASADREARGGARVS
eukprot:scaffold1849_cov107-Isochrysis_galbana.AAC.11